MLKLSDIELEAKEWARYPFETLMISALKEIVKQQKNMDERLTKLESKIFR